MSVMSFDLRYVSLSVLVRVKVLHTLKIYIYIFFILTISGCCGGGGGGGCEHQPDCNLKGYITTEVGGGQIFLLQALLARWQSSVKCLSALQKNNIKPHLRLLESWKISGVGHCLLQWYHWQNKPMFLTVPAHLHLGDCYGQYVPWVFQAAVMKHNFNVNSNVK